MEFYDGLLSATAAHAVGGYFTNEVFGTLSTTLAQTPTETIILDEVPVAVEGPQVIIAVLSGVILAFGFQLLLTNLSMAAGVSYAAHSSSSSSDSSSSGSSGSIIKKISVAFGAWTLVTVCLALFFACWMAVTLNVYPDARIGAITGLIIWALYFSMLTWFSSTAVGSMVGSVVKSATSGFQSMVGTATAALGAKAAGDEIVQTAEAAAAAVRREFTQGVDTESIQDNLQRYIGKLRSNDFDMSSVEEEFERLIKKSELVNADGDLLPEVSTDTFAELLSDRTDLSKDEVKQLSKRLYRTWTDTAGKGDSSSSGVGISDLMGFVASATGGQLASQGLSKQLEQLVGEVRQQNKQGGQKSSRPDPIKKMLSQQLNAMIGMVMGKADLADLDANKIVGQIKSAQNELAGSTDSAIPKQLKDAMPADENTIKLDVENYIQHAYVGELKSDQLEDAFRNVLYDIEADESELREQLSGFGRDTFTKALLERGMLTQDEIKDISTRMEIVRQTVLKNVTAAEAVAAEKRIKAKIATFFEYTPASELSSEMGDKAFRAIIEDEPLDVETLRKSLSEMNAAYFRQFMMTRDDVAAHETSEHYEKLLQRVIADAEGVEKAAKMRLQQQQQSLEEYLRSTGKDELNPDAIKRDLQKLLDEPNEGIRRIRGRVSQFDRNTLVSLLSQRPEFSEQEINGVVDSVEQNWTSTLSAPQKVADKAKVKYDEATSAIEEYLRSTGKPELSPTGIKRDLQKLMDNPKVGARAIRFRLSKMDRSTLVALLSQRGDLNESEVNQTIDSLFSNVEGLIRSPRRLARRAQSSTKSQTRSFQSGLEDYLSNTNKDELNPEGIKRDVKTLLNDPKLGASKLSDRVAQMDDSTMVALLAQRPDMTEDEAKEIVGRVADVRHQITDQIDSIKRTLESAIDSIFASIRDYLQSLDRPELDYYDIKSDVRTLFDDPQAGVGALRDRLSRFDRDTLVAIVTSHNRISRSDANRVIDQVESARDSVIGKAERMEQQIEHRIATVKAQTQQQIEDAKAAAEAASWWLFGTALLSAIVSALGGVLAVTGVT